MAHREHHEPGKALNGPQREALRLAANSLSCAEIGRVLGRSETAVGTLLKQAYSRLGLRGRQARTLAAIRLLNEESPGWRTTP